MVNAAQKIGVAPLMTGYTGATILSSGEEKAPKTAHPTQGQILAEELRRLRVLSW